MEKQPEERYKLPLTEQLPELTNTNKKIRCTACSHEIPAADININDKIAKCSNCDTVFSFENELTDLLEKKKTKQEVIRPAGIDLFRFRDELEFTIQQPWTVVEILLISFLPFIAVLLTLVSLKKGGIPDWVLLSFWLGSIGIIINAFLRPKHKVYIAINDQHLTIQWRPKKFQKDQQYQVGEIDQVYTRKVEHQYGVYMIINGAQGQKHVKVISGLDSASKARYLEQEIERHLGIIDREVPEEL